MYDSILHQKTSSCVEVGTCRFVQIWKFWYEQVSLAPKSLQSKSEQNLVHSHIIGFLGSGLGLVKIVLGKYIPDWEAGNPWSPSSLSPLEYWIHHHFPASWVTHLFVSFYLIYFWSIWESQVIGKGEIMANYWIHWDAHLSWNGRCFQKW
jgi:hypothetical protein